jgi:MFS transporter, UMF1 family
MSVTNNVVGPGPQRDLAARKSEQFGWKMFDWAWSTFVTTVLAVFLGPYLTEVAKAAAEDSPTGRIWFFGAQIRPESFYFYVITLSVIIQIIALPVAGAIADRAKSKKMHLAFYSYVASIATMGFYFVTGDNYLLGGALLFIANVAFGCAGVVYNSILPDIATLDERDKVSSTGWAFGYASGALMLVINLVMVQFLPDLTGQDSGFAVRVALLSAGVWWALWMIVPLRRLMNRPPVDSLPAGPAVKASFGQLRHTIGEAKNYKMTLMFLLAYLLYKDGIATIFSSAAVFATGSGDSGGLGLTSTTVVVGVLIINVVGIGGALLMARIAGRIGTKNTILGALVVWIFVCIFGYFMPANSSTIFFVLAASIGLVIAGTQALSRSLFSRMIPRNSEAEYFALYGLGERGTSWIGTLAFGIALDVTGSYRIAIVVLIIFFVLGGLVLSRVDVERAVRESGQEQPAETVKL